jgi:phosphinothricin acetyltransferase
METRTVVIRSGKAEDLHALTEIYNHYVETTPATFDVLPFASEGRRSWLNQFSAIGPHRLFVAEIGGLVVGYASSFPFDGRAAYISSIETEVFLAPSARGQGLGRQLYDALFDSLASEDVHRAFAGITTPNDAALNLHRAVGFEKTGVFREAGRKFGKYWDVMWLSKNLGTSDPPSHAAVHG